MLTNDDDDYDLTFAHAVVGLKSMVYSEAQAYGTGTAYSKTVTKVYDAMGRKATEAYPGGMNLTYVRNGLGQLTSVNDGTTAVGTYTYWGSREKGVTFGNGATQSNTYGGFRQEVTSIHHQDSGSGTLVRMDYGYNAVHDRTYERFGAGGSPGEAFEYDKMRRLTKAWMGSSTPSSPSGQPHTETIDFNMDDDGNRSSKVHTAYLGSPASTSYTTNGLNQYTAVGAASLTYDGNGNLVDDGTYYYEYDYRNQLIEVGHSGGAVIATYRYDAMGRRVEKNVQGPGITRFIMSGLEVIETCAGQTTWAQSFVYADGIDHVISMRQADVLDWDADLDTSELVWSYYHRNALGSVMFISEPDETEAATYRYTPYGEMTIKRGGFVQGSDPLDQDIGYTGRWYDAEAGVWQYRARAYSAALGRFLQRDPVGLLTGPGLYTYAVSSPAVWRDPTGLVSERDLIVEVPVGPAQWAKVSLKFKCDGVTAKLRGGASGLRKIGPTFLRFIDVELGLKWECFDAEIVNPKPEDKCPVDRIHRQWRVTVRVWCTLTTTTPVNEWSETKPYDMAVRSKVLFPCGKCGGAAPQTAPPDPAPPPRPKGPVTGGAVDPGQDRDGVADEGELPPPVVRRLPPSPAR